jgi:hypothetical protein
MKRALAAGLRLNYLNSPSIMWLLYYYSCKFGWIQVIEHALIWSTSMMPLWVPASPAPACYQGCRELHSCHAESHDRFFGWKGHVNETKWDQWACTGLLPITMNSEKIINFVWKYIWWGIVGRFLEWVGAPRADLTPWLTLNHGCLPPNEWILSELLFSRSGPDLMWQQCLELNLKTKESNHFNISISGDLDMLDV